MNERTIWIDNKGQAFDAGSEVNLNESNIQRTSASVWYRTAFLITSSPTSREYARYILEFKHKWLITEFREALYK